MNKLWLSSVLGLFALASCKPSTESTNERGKLKGSPSAEASHSPEPDSKLYVDSKEADIRRNQSGQVVLNETSIKFGANSADDDFRVRISRRSDAPSLEKEQSAIIGSPESDVVDVEVYNPVSNQLLKSSDLRASYQFAQEFETESKATGIGLFIVNNRGTSEEEAILIPNDQLSISEKSALGMVSSKRTLLVQVSLRVTNATVWLATYGEQALSNFRVLRANEVVSESQREVETVVVTGTGTSNGTGSGTNSGTSSGNGPGNSTAKSWYRVTSESQGALNWPTPYDLAVIDENHAAVCTAVGNDLVVKRYVNGTWLANEVIGARGTHCNACTILGWGDGNYDVLHWGCFAVNNSTLSRYKFRGGAWSGDSWTGRSGVMASNGNGSGAIVFTPAYNDSRIFVSTMSNGVWTDPPIDNSHVIATGEPCSIAMNAAGNYLAGFYSGSQLYLIVNGAMARAGNAPLNDGFNATVSCPQVAVSASGKMMATYIANDSQYGFLGLLVAENFTNAAAGTWTFPAGSDELNMGYTPSQSANITPLFVEGDLPVLITDDNSGNMGLYYGYYDQSASSWRLPLNDASQRIEPNIASYGVAVSGNRIFLTWTTYAETVDVSGLSTLTWANGAWTLQQDFSRMSPLGFFDANASSIRASKSGYAVHYWSEHDSQNSSNFRSYYNWYK